MDDIIETRSVGNMVHMSVNGEYTQKFLSGDGTTDAVNKELFDTKLLPKLQAFAQANGMAPIQSSVAVEGEHLQYTSGKFGITMYEQPGGNFLATTRNKFVFEFNTYDETNQELITAEQQDDIIEIIEAFVQEVVAPVESPIKIIEQKPEKLTFEVTDTNRVFLDTSGRFKNVTTFNEIQLPGQGWNIGGLNTASTYTKFIMRLGTMLRLQLNASSSTSFRGVIEIGPSRTSPPPDIPSIDDVYNSVRSYFIQTLPATSPPIESPITSPVTPRAPVQQPLGAPVRSLSGMTAETQVAQPLTPSANAAPDLFEPTPRTVGNVIERVFSESDLGGSGYEGEIELSPLVKQVLYKPIGNPAEQVGVLNAQAIDIIGRKLDTFADNLERQGITLAPFRHTSPVDEEDGEIFTSDIFTSRVQGGGVIDIRFNLIDGGYLYLLWDDQTASRVNFRTRVETIIRETVQELQGVATEPAPVQSQPPVQVFGRIDYESDTGIINMYEGRIELSPIAKEVLCKPSVPPGTRGLLKDQAAALILQKLNAMRSTLSVGLAEFSHVALAEVEGDEVADDTFDAKFSTGDLAMISFREYSVYILWEDPTYARTIKDKVEQILKETVQELQGGTAARALDFGAEAVDNQARLRGPNDRELKFYETLAPAFSIEAVQAAPLPINNTVFDQEMNEDAMLSDFMLPGGKLVFLYNGKQTGISYLPLMKKVKEGDGIFYECTRVFPFNPNGGQLGTFEFYDIYAQPYIELALTSRFYIPLTDFQKLLSVPVHPYWEIKDTGKTLSAAASRSSVVAGGPIMSQLHCQDGSDLKVYSLSAYMPTPDPEDEEEDACPIPQIVTLQRGEERTQVDISENNTVLGAKTWYANEKGLTLSTLKMIFMGKILKDEDLLTPGTVVMVMGGQGGRRTYRRHKRSKSTRKTSKA